MKTTMTKEQLASLDLKTCTDKELIEALKVRLSYSADGYKLCNKQTEAHRELERRAVEANGGNLKKAKLIRRTEGGNDRFFVRRADGSLAEIMNGGEREPEFWCDYFGDGSEKFDALWSFQRRYLLVLIAAIKTFEGAR